MESRADREWEVVSTTPGAEGLGAAELRAALEDASKLWLAHDGLWFQQFEKRHGMEEAIEADKAAWNVFTKLEAKRIMARLGMKPGGGLDALGEAFRHRLYSNINVQRIERTADGRKLRLTMEKCRVQEARRRKGMDDFPCKPVGIIEYTEFAKTIDPRAKTTCKFCPPDELPDDAYCRWEFELEDEG